MLTKLNELQITVIISLIINYCLNLIVRSITYTCRIKRLRAERTPEAMSIKRFIHTIKRKLYLFLNFYS